jgi:LysM repeat protein
VKDLKKYSVFHCYDKRLVENSEYIVQKGDTLFKIARMNGVAVEDLIAANNLVSNLIHPGQIIIIPKSVPGGGVYFEEYTIQVDDTMEKIAQKLNVRLDLLTKYNDMTKLLLAENQVIKIPRSFNLYTIGPGDTLETILMNHDMKLEELIMANMNTWLAVGQTINVK